MFPILFRVTHATPSALYAKTAHRDWECDRKMPPHKPHQVIGGQIGSIWIMSLTRFSPSGLWVWKDWLHPDHESDKVAFIQILSLRFAPNGSSAWQGCLHPDHEPDQIGFIRIMSLTRLPSSGHEPDQIGFIRIMSLTRLVSSGSWAWPDWLRLGHEPHQIGFFRVMDMTSLASFGSYVKVAIPQCFFSLLCVQNFVECAVLKINHFCFCCRKLRYKATLPG